MPLPLLLLRRPSPAPSFLERDLLAYLRGKGVLAFPGHIPQKTPPPAVSFLLVSGDHWYRLSGAAGLAMARVQFTVSGRNYLDAGAHAERLRKYLQGLQNQTLGRTRVHSVLLRNDFAEYAPAVDGGDRGEHTKIGEYEIYYKESIPTF